MNFSELSISSEWIICFTSFGSFTKLLTLHSKIVNPFEKYYSKYFFGNFNMTTEFMFFKNTQQDIRFMKKYWIPVPNILSKHFSPYLELPIEPTVISLLFIYLKAK